jgi:putative addiction module component (TIGR02574 family)
MSQRADQLFEEAQALPADERAILALQLLDSVGSATPDVERAWLDEARLRLEDVEAGHATLGSWEEARLRIFARK